MKSSSTTKHFTLVHFHCSIAFRSPFVVYQVIEKRKVAFPDRPLIRISSTFFWHLSSDYDLVPIPALVDKAQKLRDAHAKAGKSDGDEVLYQPMKVGQQVAKYVVQTFFRILHGLIFVPSELKHIALMA